MNVKEEQVWLLIVLIRINSKQNCFLSVQLDE